MLIPGLAVVAVFCYFPLYGLVIGFQDYNPALGFHSHFVGIDNFRYVFSQPNFVRTIWNTLYISIFKIAGGIVVPVTFALMLNEVRHAAVKRFFQTLVYVPYFLSWVILAGVLIDIFSIDGIINTALSRIGTKPIPFLSSPTLFPWTMILTDIWKNFGFGTVIYLASLTGIDPGLYEAAIVDGAKRWKQTVYITIPLLIPIVLLMCVLSLGNVFNAGFDQIYNMYSPVVYSSGDILDTYIYRLGIEQAQYSVGAAVGMFRSVATCALMGLSYVLADKVAGYRVF